MNKTALKKTELTTTEAQTIPHLTHRETIPLSFAQQRLWFLEQLEPENPFYNLTRAMQLKGVLDIEALRQAFNIIIARHDVLRTTFVVVDGEPKQFIADSGTVELPVIVVETGENQTKPEIEAQRLLGEIAQRPFDLSSELMLRPTLLQLASDEYILLIVVHHSASDDWSMGLLFQELTTVYNAILAGESFSLPELPIQYADFAVWQRQWLQGEVLEAQLNYWKQQLEDIPSVLALPTDKPRPAIQTFRGAKQSITLSANLTNALKTLSQQQGVTLFMTLLASFQFLLHRYTGQDDIVVGTPIAGRHWPETMKLIGFFINTLVLRTHFDENLPFQALLTQVRRMAWGAYTHPELPFETLVEALQPERNLSHSPLFQVMFVFHNAPVKHLLELEGLTTQSIPLIDSGTAKFDLTLTLAEKESKLQGSLEYNTDLFEAAIMTRMISHFQVLLEGIVAHPEQRLSNLPLLTSAEQQQLLAWNQTQVDYPQNQCIHQLFEKQVEKTPHAIAALFEDQTLTYHELNNKANQLAHKLQSLGVKPETVVAICVERSVEMVISLLSVLKAGGAYLPLDPTYPAARLAFMLENAQVSLLLTQSHLIERLPKIQTEVICLDSIDPVSALSEANPSNGVKAENLAYVIYTSGSTGQPKGIAMTQGALVNLILWQCQNSRATLGTKTLQFAPFGFDVHFQEMFSTWCSGGTLVLISEALRQDIPALLDFLHQSAIERLFLPFVALQQMAEVFSLQNQPLSLREIITAGEQLQITPALRNWFNQLSHCRLHNHYGPSETHVVTALALTGSVNDWPQLPAIGHPIANIQIYILDSHLQLCPIGVPGELYIGGKGLARGYLNQPALTDEKFIKNPFSKGSNSRLYKTGDLARYLPDGQIEFLGRIDNQVKIRGFRIELGEIESILATYPNLKESLVVVQELESGDKRLIAYGVPHLGLVIELGELRPFLQEKLPDHMIPVAFVALDHLPLTPNGKVDRRVLSQRSIERSQFSESSFVPPKTPQEKLLAHIWTQVLGIEQISIHDNFFELGGHSLLATQVMSRIRETFEVEFPLRQLFESPTIAQLSHQLSPNTSMMEPSKTLLSPAKRALLKQRLLKKQHLETKNEQTIPRLIDREIAPLSFAQQRLWFLQQLEPESPFYNVTKAIRLSGRLDIKALQQALNTIVTRHEVLRTTLISVDGHPKPFIAENKTVELPVIAIGENKSQSEKEIEIQRLIDQESQRLFDLSSDLMLRSTLFQLESTEYLLLLVIHHIASDGWSTGILFQELSTLYEAYANNQSSPLSPLPIQYADFAHWQRQWLSGEILKKQLTYWKHQLAHISQINLPTDYPRPTIQNYQGAKQSLKLSQTLIQRLKHLSRQENVTLFMTLLTAFKILLNRQSGQTDMVVGTPIAARHQTELEGLIGLFLNNLVLRTDLSDYPSFQTLLHRVRQIFFDAHAHQDLPFEKIVEELHPERDLSRHPVFEIMFNFVNIPKTELKLTGLTLHYLELAEPNSKFLMTLYVREQEQELRLDLVYQKEIFSPERMSHFLAQYQYLLEQIAADPQLAISAYSLVTSKEQSLLPDPSTEIPEPQYETVPFLLMKWGNQTPSQIAIRQGLQTWTYHELIEKSQALAQVLQAQGLKPGEVVAVSGPRCFGLIVSLVSVFLSGGILLTVDPRLPRTRQQLMLKEAQAQCVLYLGKIRAEDEWLKEILFVINVDSNTGESTPLLQANRSEIQTLPDPDEAAYIFFTSGTTGIPKGILGCHKGLAHFLHWQRQTFAVKPQDRCAQLTGLSFDVVLRDIFLPLTSGATLCLPMEIDELDLLSWLEREKISLLHTVPSLAQSWLMIKSADVSLRHLQQVFFAGEPLPEKLIRQWRDAFPGMGEIINLYGPTETTLAKCYYRIPSEVQLGIQPIGKPLPETQALVLNRKRKLCGLGEAGEIVLRTPFRSLGYINAPQENQRLFVKNPFRDDDKDLLFYTGDKGRYRPDGCLEILGRLDNQVKIRGIRIELEEIEVVLAQHPSIQTCVILMREDQSDNKYLVAYFVAQSEPIVDNNQLRTFLKSQLPDYMIPSVFIPLDHLPLTPNGKVDRRALSQRPIDQSQWNKETFVGPQTPKQELLAGIWTQVLGIEPIGIHDNFFELGGHSLLATQVMSRIRETFEVEIPLRQLFESPTIAGLSHQLNISMKAEPSKTLLSPVKQALLKQKLLKKQHSETTQYKQTIPRLMDREIAPLSFAQQRLWFLQQLEPESPFYNVTKAIHLSGRLDIKALQQALNTIVARHEVLRTTLISVDGHPKPFIAENKTVELPVIAIGENKSQSEKEIEIQRLIDQESQRLFDLSSDLMLRSTLFQLESTEYLLLLVIHHIASDGWSTGILFQELSTLYEAYANNQSSPLSPLPIQYADFAHWQRQWLTGEVLEQQLTYWKQQLASAPALLELPTDYPRPPIQRFQGAHVSITLSLELTRSLKQLSQKTGTTLFMTLLSAFAILLFRYSGQSDIVIGSPIANRTHRQIESLIGFFVNTLALRLDLSGHPNFKTLLQQTRQIALEAYSHQDIPFEKLVEELKPKRNLSHSPLFQVLFVLQNASRTPLTLTGLTLTPLELQSATAKFDLSLSLNETTEGLVGRLEYNTDLFERSTIERFLDHWQTLLKGIIENPETPIDELPLLTQAEQQQLLTWNQTQTDYPQTQCIHQLFEEQVEKTPDAVAVVFEQQQLTYRELNEQANQLAHYLISLGVKSEVLVGICVERSLTMVVGLLGILKAGGAYIPLDPTYPKARLAFMLEDSQVPILLTQSHLSHELPKVQTKIVYLETDISTRSSLNEKINPSNRVQPENLAYVIYTSGSTGKPKGVQIGHSSLLNFLISAHQKLGLTSNDVLLAITTLSFDIAALELYLPLIIGAKIILVSREMASDGLQLLDRLKYEDITVLQATPVTWHLLIAAGWQSSPQLKILCGGEACPFTLATSLLEKGQTLWNLYGPTETTIYSTMSQISIAAMSTHFNTVPIGHPIANTQVYLLDSAHQLVPIGIPGELHIGGAGLAKGYLNRADLTHEKFIENPFNNDPDSRLYKTGDLARYWPDGQIEFLGRIDHQIKIRGFRIELGEIETALATHPNIQKNVVIVQESESGDKRLITYWIPNKGQSIDSKELRTFLQKKLPDYMIPSIFITLDHFPLTPNGKVDRQALSQRPIDQSQWSQETFVAPQTPKQELLADLWTQVLSVDPIGIHDNFFELGGHSLLATQVMSRIRETFEVELPLRQLFESPTIAGLSHQLEQSAQLLVLPAITPIDRSKTLHLSFAQQRLWFLNQLEGPSSTYNISTARRLEGPLNQKVLEHSLKTVIQRHESLRTTFKTVEGQAIPIISSTVNSDFFTRLELQTLPSQKQVSEIQRLVHQETQQTFNLERGPLFRAILLSLGTESHILILTMHHIISDGWSIGILLRELSALYQAFSQDQPSPLAPLLIQYADFANWQRQWLSGEILEQQLAYWKQQLAEAPALLELPTDHPRPPIQRFQGTHVPIVLSLELTTSLKQLSQQAGSTLFMTLLSAFAILLSRYSGQSDIVIGSPIANRIHQQIESLIGFFVNTLALRLDLSARPRFKTLLQQTRRVALDAYSHQDIPFEKLVEELKPPRNLSHSPLFQVLFVLQNAPKTPLAFTGLTSTPLELQSATAKFDLSLSLNETTEGLVGRLEYNTDLFERSTIERFLAHWQTLLKGIVENPETSIAELPLLTQAEQQQLLSWNQTQTDYPQTQCIHQLFEQQVEKTPDAVAVVFEQQQLTYRELNDQANQLAHYLISLGVKPEALVGICVERSHAMIIGLLSILKVGCAYVPLDPTYPKARLAFMLEDTQVPVLLTQSYLIEQIPETKAITICLDTKIKELLSWPIENLSLGFKTTNLAYIIYTSGSTGQPKGVAIPHQAISRLVFNTPYIHLESTDRMAQASNISFDAATFEIWGALLHGAQLIGITKDILLSPPTLATYLREQKISVIFLTTALFNQLAREQPTIFQSVRQVLFGGEAVEPKWVAKILDTGPPQRLLHVYGPTENTTFTTWYLVTQVAEGVTNIPIGRPIANTQVYILDQNHQQVPIGVPGELYIGGVGLAQGYLNRSLLTAEKFIKNPFSDNPDSRLYKTGDLVRYLPDGHIEFLDRIDHQVKIRGFRIELGEIEAVLVTHPTVQEAVVIVQVASGDKRLIAYVTASQGQLIDYKILQSFVQTQLPDYMRPMGFVSLESMPLTPNGKIDRRALSQLSVDLTGSEKSFVAPQTPEEKRLAKIWVQVLGVKRVGLHDNFFDLGGHSLLAVILLSKIEKKFGQNLPLTTLFQNPTVGQLAQVLAQVQESRPYLSLIPIQPQGSKPPLFCVPPAGNTVTGFIDLVRHLGPQQPIYGLQPLGLDGQQAPHERVEEMAAHYLKEIRTFQPQGPYYLAGLCFGSHVALEMAHQLQTQGDTVALLALLDPSTPVPEAPQKNAEFENLNALGKLGYYGRRALYHYQRGQWFQLFYVSKDFLGRRFRWLKTQLSPRYRRRLQRVMAAHQIAIKHYTPPVYSGQIILFRSQQFEALEKKGEGPWAKPWSDLTSVGLVRHVIPGEHREILQEPQVQILAQRLKACLDDAQST